MIKPESLSIASHTISGDLFGTLSETTANLLGTSDTFDYAKYLGELLAAPGSNAG